MNGMSQVPTWLLYVSPLAVLAGLLITVLTLIRDSGIKTEAAKRAHDKALNAVMEGLREDIADYRANIASQRENDLRNIGEAITAIRNTVAEFKLYCEQNFARRESFHTVTGRLETRIVASEEKLEGKINKLDEKFDAVMDRITQKLNDIHVTAAYAKSLDQKRD